MSIQRLTHLASVTSTSTGISINISLLADSTPVPTPARAFLPFVREFASEEADTRLTPG